MNDKTPTTGHDSPFKRIRRTNAAGAKYWSSRDFAGVLGYADYRNFEQVIGKARLACFNSGQRIEDHFVDITEMIEIGKGGQRPVKTVMLSHPCNAFPLPFSFKRGAMSRILAVAILFSLGITTCALAETVTNAAASNAAPDMVAVDAMSGLVFEKLVASLLARQGYEVGNLRASNDYGVDMIIHKDKERIAVQVKRSKNKIARKAISDAVAGMKYYNCTKAMVVTNSEFTEDAREFARGTECILIDRTILQQWLDSFKILK